jgi:hypothetical protein
MTFEKTLLVSSFVSYDTNLVEKLNRLIPNHGNKLAVDDNMVDFIWNSAQEDIEYLEQKYNIFFEKTRFKNLSLNEEIFISNMQMGLSFISDSGKNIVFDTIAMNMINDSNFAFLGIQNQLINLLCRIRSTLAR